MASHRDPASIQGRHHKRPPLPAGTYATKGITRRDNKGRDFASQPRTSRTQLYNSFVASDGFGDDSRDPFHDDIIANLDEDSYVRFIKERRDGKRYTTRPVKGIRPLKQTKQQNHRRQTSSSTRATQESCAGGREGTSSLKKIVSFVDGGRGDAVTVIHHNSPYTEEEKAVCFYTDRDFRRFRAEHFLGIAYVENEDDSSPQAVQDLLELVGDMWNSFVDNAISSMLEIDG